MTKSHRLRNDSFEYYFKMIPRLINSKNLALKFQPYIQAPIFLEVLDLVKQNSRGKIWLIGGYLYRNLWNALYKGQVYDYDIDFIVEEKSNILKDIPNWKIEVNSYGNPNYVRKENKMSFTDISKVIRISGQKIQTIEKFIEETPLNIQSIAYDLENNNIIGEKGINALISKNIAVNNLGQAEFYANKKGKKIEDILKEKISELNFLSK